MKIRLTNRRTLPVSTDVVNSEGAMIRVLVPPVSSIDVSNIDPFFLNQDKNLRNQIFVQSDLLWQFIAEPDDLIGLPSGTVLGFKDPARVATTANIVLSGLLALDGVATASGDRVLVKNQLIGSENGLYEARAGAWVRAPDADTNSELIAGTLVVVTEGITQADTGWVVTTNNPIVVGTTPIVWGPFPNISAALTPTAHQVLRQLIHFIDEGPGSGFATGAFKEILPSGSAFPTSITWYTDATRTQRIVEKIIDRTTPPANNVRPTPITWRVYDAATGTVIVGEIVDTITYSGAIETTRTRAVNV